jgi:hypothetical protein
MRAPTTHQDEIMKTYIIRRRNGWRTPEQLQEAAALSRKVGDEQMPTDVRWIRSYVVQEPDGSLGTVCVYQATSEEALREHAARAMLPADEITLVNDTVIVRDDPAAPTDRAA